MSICIKSEIGALKKVPLQRPGRELEHLSPDTIEGGDIINLSDTVLAVGISQRTRPEAIELLAKSIFSQEESSIDTVPAFEIHSLRPQRTALYEYAVVHRPRSYLKQESVFQKRRRSLWLSISEEGIF